MGTVVEITLVGEDEETTRKAALQAFQEIKRIETLMSPWIDSSDVTRMNRSAGKERGEGFSRDAQGDQKGKRDIQTFRGWI
jgi:thiamine biosynthesis lipoprotein ApbE